MVRAWSKALSDTFGVEVSEYPARGRGQEIRAYCDLDDRVAATVAFGKPARAVKVIRKGGKAGGEA